MEITYLDEVPESIPDGLVLMHNVEAGYQHRPIGSGGFRVWLAEPGQPNQQPCDCGWEGFGAHVRTKRPQPPGPPAPLDESDQELASRMDSDIRQAIVEQHGSGEVK
jgi:hypothetical protein